jgi:hypothetical protein
MKRANGLRLTSQLIIDASSTFNAHPKMESKDAVDFIQIQTIEDVWPSHYMNSQSLLDL